MKVVFQRKRKGGQYRHVALMFEFYKERNYAIGIKGGKVCEVATTPPKGWVYDYYKVIWPDKRANWLEKQIEAFVQKHMGCRRSLFREGFKLSADTDPQKIEKARQRSGKWHDAELVMAALRKGGVHTYRNSGRFPFLWTPHTLAQSGNLAFHHSLYLDGDTLMYDINTPDSPMPYEEVLRIRYQNKEALKRALKKGLNIPDGD